MPRRRRGAAAAAEAERGLVMRALLHSPKDTVAGLLAFAACSAIVANALFLQTGQHPAPMFGAHSASVASPALLPRPRPFAADAASPELRLAEPRLAEPRLIEPRASDPVANLVKATAAAPSSSTPLSPAPPSSMMRPPASTPSVQITGSRRVAAVQRALSENGYGQLKATGTIGADTQAAIQKFERERHIPVTGQMSERLVRELAIVTGHPID